MLPKGYDSESEEEGEVEHENLKEDLRKAKQYLAQMDPERRDQELEEGEIGNSSFRHYEDFRISKSIDDIREQRSKSIRSDLESGKARDRLREKDNSRRHPEAAKDINDLLDEGLEMLDSMGVPSNKLNPSLAARLGPEVNSVKAKVQSLVQSGKRESRSKSLSRSKSPSRPSQHHQQSRQKHIGGQEEKENRVVEVLDSDQEEGEFKADAAVEVIQIDDDDAPYKKSHRGRSQKRKSEPSPDVTIVEEKSHGPPSKHKSERKRKKSPSRLVCLKLESFHHTKLEPLLYYLL